MIRSSVRRTAALGLLLPALLLGACEDQRDNLVSSTSSFLDGDGLFGVSVVTAAILGYQNELAERAVEIVENFLPTPIFEQGCTGAGNRVITRDLANPNIIRFRHGDPAQGTVVGVNCDGFPLTLSGIIEFEVVSTSPVQYRIRMPFCWSLKDHDNDPDTPDILTGTPVGMNYQLAGGFGGGVILSVSIAGDPAVPVATCSTAQAGAGWIGAGDVMDCQEENGVIRQTGTLRVEDRVRQILLVEEIDVTYRYDPGVSPAFATWPSGVFELGALAPEGFFGPQASPPTDVTLDGFGGATFRLGSRICQVNLADLENGNPCEDL